MAYTSLFSCRFVLRVRIMFAAHRCGHGLQIRAIAPKKHLYISERSGMYESEAARENGITSVQNNAPDASIEDLSN